MIYWNKGIVHKNRKLKIKARPIFVIQTLIMVGISDSISIISVKRISNFVK